jgi:hypothetical protein
MEKTREERYRVLDDALVAAFEADESEFVVVPENVWPHTAAPGLAVLKAMAEHYKKRHFGVSWTHRAGQEPRLVLQFVRAAEAELEVNVSDAELVEEPTVIVEQDAPAQVPHAGTQEVHVEKVYAWGMKGSVLEFDVGHGPAVGTTGSVSRAW